LGLAASPVGAPRSILFIQLAEMGSSWPSMLIGVLTSKVVASFAHGHHCGHNPSEETLKVSVKTARVLACQSLRTERRKSHADSSQTHYVVAR
jgi:hypothetical protein